MSSREKEKKLMVRIFICALVLCGVIAVTVSEPLISGASHNGPSLQESEAAHESIRTAINDYFKGHATGDASYMRKAFLPTAHIEGIREGKFTSWTLDEYSAGFKGKPANDEASRTRTIDSIDVSGNAAMVKATLVHGATTFTDYFVLLKVGEEWKIANKVYSARRK